MGSQQFTLDEHNSLLMEQYQKDNFRVLDLDAKKKTCFIFFSSNGLYFPNDVETFQQTVVEKDRYEWENIAQSSLIRRFAGRLIFVRDLFKAWYVTGINARVNSIDKLIAMLKDLTEGYEVITCGGSAGGYMSTLGGAGAPR